MPDAETASPAIVPASPVAAVEARDPQAEKAEEILTGAAMHSGPCDKAPKTAERHPEKGAADWLVIRLPRGLRSVPLWVAQ